MNAAIWFGAAVFFLFGAGPATLCSEVKMLLGARNAPYFSVAIEQVVTGWYFRLYLACSIVAALHLMAEWLYFGKYPQRPWGALMVGLCLVGLLQVYGIQPRLKTLHETRFRQPQLHQSAGRSYAIWHGVSTTLNGLLVIGLGIYLWRRANPSDPTRFVSATKFRS